MSRRLELILGTVTRVLVTVVGTLLIVSLLVGGHNGTRASVPCTLKTPV
jgi:hypothetical protein